MSGTSARLGLKTFIDRNYLVQYTERYVEMEYMARRDLLGRSLKVLTVLSFFSLKVVTKSGDSEFLVCRRRTDGLDLAQLQAENIR